MPWDDCYDTGHLGIDRQHRLLLEMIEKIGKVEGEAFMPDKNAALDLMELILQHAAYEEGLMAKHAYPKAEAHRESHRAFTHKIINFREDIIGGQLKYEEYQKLIDVWWQEHVRGGDIELAAFLAGRQ